MPRKRSDTAGVIAPPPLLYGGALAAGLLLHATAPFSLTPDGYVLLWPAGALLIALGTVASAAVVWEFRKGSTAVSPLRPSTRLVCGGPYRFSRNPDYLGQMSIYVGTALAANTWWPLLLLPLTVVAVQRGVIRREERYLEARFGQEYRDYKQRVRRWL